MEQGPAGIEGHLPEVAETPAQREVQRGILKRLRGMRGKIGATVIALAGAGAMPEKSDAATMMIEGEVVTDYHTQPAYALALRNYEDEDNYDMYNIAHADGTADATMSWFSVRSPELLLERYADNGSDPDVPYTMVQPDQLNDGVRSPFLLVLADVPEEKSLRYRLDVRNSNGFGRSLNAFLRDAEVHAGFGPLTGMPQTIEEAIEMTDGPVMWGMYPNSVNQMDHALIFRNAQSLSVPLAGDHNGDGVVDAADYVVWRKQSGTQDEYNDWRGNFGTTINGSGSAITTSERGGVPEPSTLVMAGMGLAGVGLAARRRLREALNPRT